jgi:hypothetical protein
MSDIQEKILELMDLFDDDEVTTADKINRPEPKQSVKEIELFNEFNIRNPKAGGGMLVQPSADGSRPGYAGDAIKLPDSPDAGSKHLGGGVYEVTSKKGFKTYFGKYERDGNVIKKNFGKDKKAAENFVKEGRKTPPAKSVIDLQSEGGTLLEKPKYKNTLARAMNEVTALGEKGYGNIDSIIKKYQKIFTKKIGSKTIQGKTVTKGVGSTEYRAITLAINQQAEKLGIQNIQNNNIIKALDAYSKIKTPKRGDIAKIVRKYNINEGSFNRYLTKDKLNLRKKIPIKFGSELEKKRYYAKLRNEAIAEFSSKKFEKFFQAPQTALVQKSHMGDLYNQYVRTGNLGYAPNLINQETLKDVDAILKNYNEQIDNLLKNKPKNYIKKVNDLNRKGTDLAAATQGYKKFTGRDPFTGEEFTINYSRPGQEFDPGDVYGNKKLSELTKKDKIIEEYNPRTKKFVKVNKPLLDYMKKQSIKSAKLSPTQIKKIDTQIRNKVLELASTVTDRCPIGNADGGRIGYSLGSEACFKIGKQKLENIILKGGAKGKELDLAKTILRAGGGVKSMLSLRGALGPAALAFTAATEAGLVGYDMLAKGQTFREAVGDSLFNYALGDKTKIDPRSERYKSYQAAGVDQNTLGKIAAFENTMDEVQYLQQEFDKEGRLADSILSGRGKGRMSDAMQQKQTQNYFDQRDSNRLLLQDLQRTQSRDRMDDALDPVVPFMIADADAKRKAFQLTQPRTKAFGDFMDVVFPRGFFSDTTFQEDRDRAVNYMPNVQEYRRGNQFQFADGGLSGGDKSGPPPESGPTPHGLPGILKRVKNT